MDLFEESRARASRPRWDLAVGLGLVGLAVLVMALLGSVTWAWETATGWFRRPKGGERWGS